MFDECFYKYGNYQNDRESVNLKRLFFDFISRILVAMNNRYLSTEDYNEICRLIDIFFDEGAMEYTDPAQLREFSSWIVTTNPDTATNAPLPAPVTYSTTVSQHIATEDPDTGAISYREVLVPQDVTFTTDSPEYRLAKFKAELGDYMEVEDAKFYYLFTELFLMIDSRAKNMFPSFVGTAINEPEEVNE